MRAAHRFLWGYGPGGYDVVSREGDLRALEAPCLDEIARFKLAFDREARVVTPVHASGRPVGLLAFCSRVSARAAGDKFRETACAVIDWEHAAEHAVHTRLLDQVPGFPGTGPAATPQAAALRVTAPNAGACGRLPSWAARAWAQLLGDDAVLELGAAAASLPECLRVVALLPPVVARRVTVAEGLLPGTKPKSPALLVADAKGGGTAGAGEALPGRAAAPGAPAATLEGLAEAWFRRVLLHRTTELRDDSAARSLWARFAAEADSKVAHFGRAQLWQAMLGDAALEWLLSGTGPVPGDSLAHWMSPARAQGISLNPARLANLVAALPQDARRAIVPRLPQLAAQVAAPDAALATVIVGVAIEDALRHAAETGTEGAFLDRRTWVGSVLSGVRPGVDRAFFGLLADEAWALAGELLAQWAQERPEVLARALARPVRGASDASPGWLRRLAARIRRPRTVHDVLRRLAKKPPAAAGPVATRLLPQALRTREGRSALRPRAELLDGLFAAAVLVAARVGRKRAAAVVRALGTPTQHGSQADS